MADRMMTSLMTSRDLEIYNARYFENASRERLCYNWASIRNGMHGIEWSCGR